MLQYLKNKFILYFCNTNVNVNKYLAIAKNISSFFLKTRTFIIEKRLLAYQKRTSITSRSLFLGLKTIVAKDKPFAKQQRSKYGLIK